MTVLAAAFDDEPVALRLAHDAEGHDLVPSREERRLAEAAGRRAEEAGRLAAEAERDEVRRRAEERIAALERELAARGPR